LARFGVKEDECQRIRGPLDLAEFPFRPLERPPGTPLAVGRLSRAATDKYAKNTWAIYGRIGPAIRARVMAWDRAVEEKLGRPPSWAECLPALAETPQRFLGSLHVMIQINGEAIENWPRSGLEAMATGVTIIAPDRGGWPEMVRHGQTGYMARTSDEIVEYARRLAADEKHRLELAHAGRRYLEIDLADPETIWAGWRKVLA
jgi:glycosyltransferase involved in cell wall biosynthesis